ncbi:MAG TPA: DUF6335 family protein [Blastocatellia bacterium]|nr:DUF6335 family protein [Blastocatellia bacterium]
MSKAANKQVENERLATQDNLDPETKMKDQMADTGGRMLEEELEEYNSVSPELTAGDIDADWQGAEDSGSETPGGDVPTPDQDNVDELGRAVGLEFQDNQELQTHDEILARRDRHRWELNRSSADSDSI